jgi:hypothetical protein
MKSSNNKIVRRVGLAAAIFAVLSCNSINRESSPVKLVVTNTQNLQQIDLSGGTRCTEDVANVQMRSVLLQDQNNTTLPTDNRFNDIVISQYRVSYVRTDGGTAIPQPFVRSVSDTIISGGLSIGLTKFLVFEPGAVNQAPFAALLPVNGGRDPETGSQFVKMEVVLEVFGQTLAGERVSGTTRIPLIFCFACNGCG